MNKIFVVMVIAGMLICPVAGYAQYDSSDSGSSQSMQSEESQAQSNLSTEMSSDEAASKGAMDEMDNSMAGDSTSEQTAAEQENE